MDNTSGKTYPKYRFSNLNMSASTDDHTEEGVQPEIAASSMRDSESQLDDDCDSENSFGSYIDDNAMDEESMTADIELDSSPPDYSDEDIYARAPSADLTVVSPYTPPTRSIQPAVNARFSGHDNANLKDEGNMTADIELDSPLSLFVYSDEELDNMHARAPSADLTVEPQYTSPTRSIQPAFNPEFSGPPMCVVRASVIFN